MLVFDILSNIHFTHILYLMHKADKVSDKYQHINKTYPRG